MLCACAVVISLIGVSFALLGPLRTLLEVFKNLAWDFKNLALGRYRTLLGAWMGLIRRLSLSFSRASLIIVYVLLYIHLSHIDISNSCFLSLLLW